MQRVGQPIAAPFKLGKMAQRAIVPLGAAGLVMLAIVASGQAYTDLDVRIVGWVQGLHIPGLDSVSAMVNVLTDAPMAIALWLVAMAFFVLKGRPVEAIAIFLISGVWCANQFVGTVVDRPSPSQEISGVIEFSRTVGGSFPSGHVTGAVVFYGLLTFLTLSNVRRGHLRVSVPAVSVAIVGLTSLSRVYSGAHWPTDVLGSYLMGLMGAAGIAWFYTNVKNDTLHIPRPWGKKQADPVVNGVTVAGSIASKVYLDWKAGTATKEYHPPMPVRVLYRLAFQAPFPYQHRRDALEAAAAKRKIAGLLTRHWYGYDMVASVYGIREGEDGYRFETELIHGTEPSSNGEVEGLLAEMYAHFQEAGMPTWQIAPGNPHAYSNFIRRPNGELKLIDLESALVSVSYPWKELRAALRDGNFPVFDDVDFTRLHDYVNTHASEIAETVGPEGVEELSQAIQTAEASSRAWKDSEPRIWGRMGAWIHRRLDVSRPINAIRRRLEAAEAMSTTFLAAAVDRWEEEGKIDTQTATSLRNNLGTSEMSLVLKHLGAHMVLSVAVAVPIPGLRSLARFAWMLAFRLKGLMGLATGRITREEYRVVRSIHTVPVMLLALVPAVGAAAYAVSDPMLKGPGRMLVDQAASKLPFRLYRRLGLARLTAPRRPKTTTPVLVFPGVPSQSTCQDLIPCQYETELLRRTYQSVTGRQEAGHTVADPEHSMAA